MNKIVSGSYIVDLINKNELDISDELLIYEALQKKYPTFTIVDYAKKIGKSPNGVRYMIKNKQLPTCEVSRETMVIDI